MKQQRMTRQKQLILNIALAHHDHPTADELYLEVRGINNKISRGTVYRNLEQLSNAGLLLHVKVPGPDRFDSHVDYHYHIICTKCGMLWDVPCEYDLQADQHLMESTGFLISRHRTIFEGICPACAAKQSSDANALPTHSSETIKEI